MQNHTLRPQIVVAKTEHRQLLAIAAGDASSTAEALFDEMERATVVPDHKLPSDVVRMGSRVQYRLDNHDLKDVTIVYPAQADISAGRISVLTPVGVALIGLRTGQSITWRALDGSNHFLTVLSVI